MANDKRSNSRAGTLFVVATPIGNLEDITLRAIKVLKQVDLIAAEDTRHTRRLMTAHGINNRLISYHGHNERQRTRELTERLKDGDTIALVSDAGTPTVSDPGYRIVQAAAAVQIPIVPVPGVSAATAAISASGLATDSFVFIGFPARKKAKRLRQLEALAQSSDTMIFYQSPRRVVSFLEEMITAMGDRQAVLARELTKLHEEFVRGSLSEILAKLNQRASIKGECTLLIAGAGSRPVSENEINTAIEAALSSSDKSLSAIAKTLARQFKVPRKRIYDAALQIRQTQITGGEKKKGSLSDIPGTKGK